MPLHRGPRPLVLAIACFTGILLAPAAYAEETSRMRTVTVSASGEAVAEPDMASISSGVVAEAPSAREALSKNTVVMKKLIDGLKAAGIEAKDIQTSSFNVNPVYSNPREGQAPVITGYQVHNQVTIRARDLARLGDVLDSMVSLGANQMNGLAFEVSKAETLRDEARKAAIANARRRAELYATAAGATVGEVVSISEDTAGFHPQPKVYARAAMAEAVPIERGTQTLEANVTVTWSLK